MSRESKGDRWYRFFNPMSLCIVHMRVCVCMCVPSYTVIKANTIARDCFSCVTAEFRDYQIRSRSWDLSQGKKSNCWRDMRKEMAPSEFRRALSDARSTRQSPRISAHERDSKSTLIAWNEPPAAAANV